MTFEGKCRNRQLLCYGEGDWQAQCALDQLFQLVSSHTHAERLLEHQASLKLDSQFSRLLLLILHSKTWLMHGSAIEHQLETKSTAILNRECFVNSFTLLCHWLKRPESQLRCPVFQWAEQDYQLPRPHLLQHLLTFWLVLKQQLKVHQACLLLHRRPQNRSIRFQKSSSLGWLASLWPLHSCYKLAHLAKSSVPRSRSPWATVQSQSSY